jgi:hypothetical protein
LSKRENLLLSPTAKSFTMGNGQLDPGSPLPHFLFYSCIHPASAPINSQFFRQANSFLLQSKPFQSPHHRLGKVDLHLP